MAKKPESLKMKIRLSNKFYKRNAIEETIEAFRGSCECRIASDSFEIDIISEQGNEKEIANEFCNFVLGITKDRMLF